MGDCGSGFVIVGIDPGKEKCGVAVVRVDGEVISKTTVHAERVADAVAALAAEHTVELVALGDGTGWEEVSKRVKERYTGKLLSVSEKGTSLEARELAWREHPPPFVFRLFPKLFWPTPKDLDSWAAVVIARRAIEAFGSCSSQHRRPEAAG